MKRSGEFRQPRFELLEGSVACLDFINTLDDRPTDAPRELLRSFQDLVRFVRESRILPSDVVNRLIERSAAAPKEAHRTLRHALDLRETLNAIFSAVAKKQPVSQAALNHLNRSVQTAAQHTQIVQKRHQFERRYDSPDGLGIVLWPIAQSAAELLTSEQLHYVRMCSSPTCQWFFIDVSKNHRRRWCKMDICGNREKAKRFYSRRKRQAHADLDL